MDKVDSLLSELSLYEEYDKISNNEVERLRVEAIDRWTWDTGSEDDAELIVRLQREMNWRNRNSLRIEKEAAEKSADDQLLANFAKQVSDEVDRDLLRKIIDLTKNNHLV